MMSIGNLHNVLGFSAYGVVQNAESKKFRDMRGIQFAGRPEG